MNPIKNQWGRIENALPESGLVSESASRRPPPATPEPVLYVPGATTAWDGSWRQIYGHFGNAILAYARRAGLNDHSAEDVLQEVMMTLIRCQQGQEPGYDRQAGAFPNWLWGVIRNRVRSARRKDHKERPAAPGGESEHQTTQPARLPEASQPPVDFEAREAEQWQRALLATALQKVQERVTPENFAIYTALLAEQATPEELGRKYGKETNAIYAVKHRCETMLLTEARLLRSAWEHLV
jgi:RNA polymerase sigma factor (sigma-70 family)